MGFIEDFFKGSAKTRLSEEVVYAEVLREIESGIRRDGLWAMAIAKSNGSENAVKSEYIKLRVQSLKDEIDIYEKSLSSIKQLGFSSNEASHILALKANLTPYAELPTKDIEVTATFVCANCTYEGRFLLLERLNNFAGFLFLIVFGLIVFGLYKVFQSQPGAFIFGASIFCGFLVLGLLYKILSTKKRICPVCGYMKTS